MTIILPGGSVHECMNIDECKHKIYFWYRDHINNDMSVAIGIVTQPPTYIQLTVITVEDNNSNVRKINKMFSFCKAGGLDFPDRHSLSRQIWMGGASCYPAAHVASHHTSLLSGDFVEKILGNRSESD